MALCWAMRDVPIASTIVTRAGKPFGIIATAMETAVLKDSVAPSPACAQHTPSGWRRGGGVSRRWWPVMARVAQGQDAYYWQLDWKRPHRHHMH